MHSSSYLIKIKSSSKFIINKKIFLRFFSALLYNSCKCDLITSVLNFVNGEEASFTSALDSTNGGGVFFTSVLDSVNSRGVSFKFFFIFFSYNLYRYNLIISIFNKEVIINNI